MRMQRTGQEATATRCRRRASARLALAIVAGAWFFAAAPALPDPIAEHIRALLAPGTTAVHAGVLLGSAETRAFYGERAYMPAWLELGQPGWAAVAFRAMLADALADGLEPRRYHLGAVTALLAAPATTAADRAALDVLLTDAFLAYTRELATGRVDPRSLHRHWPDAPRSIDAGAVLRRVLAGEPVRDALERVRPPFGGYARLRIVLARYRAVAMAGGWEAMPPRVRLEAGDSGPAVVSLRRRLAAEAGSVASGSETFDDGLDRAVRAFQHSHGLEVDGIVGPRTRAALDVTVEERVTQLERELERWRWRGDPGPRLRVEVSIPAFELQALVRDSVVLSMRVIAGRPDWPTPIFGAEIGSIVLSPYWNVPTRIAALEVLPAVRRDPRYLARNEMRVVTAGGRVVDPSSIDWRNISASSFPYRFRQQPGPANPLGGIKFMLPNAFDVYLHDTSAPALFARSNRALSHGCIRIARPLDLAELLLGDRPEWTRERLLTTIAARRQREVPLDVRVPVAIRYHTAWVEPDGTVHFRDDLYSHDARLAAALAVRKVVAGTEGKGHTECSESDGAPSARYGPAGAATMADGWR